MKAFSDFLSLLATIPDPRRAEGKMYKLPYVLLFSILAVVSGANSYRGICTFIKVHRGKLNKAFGLAWRRPPAHTAIRFILQGLDTEEMEKAFRQHAAHLNGNERGTHALALDGKTLRGSFDAFNDVRARQVFSVFAADTALVLAHVEIDEKTNEIPAAQKFIKELDVADKIITLDAMHCQKKRSKPPRKRTRTSSFS